jgi:hypothetical protein
MRQDRQIVKSVIEKTKNKVKLVPDLVGFPYNMTSMMKAP